MGGVSPWKLWEEPLDRGAVEGGGHWVEAQGGWGTAVSPRSAPCQVPPLQPGLVGTVEPARFQGIRGSEIEVEGLGPRWSLTSGSMGTRLLCLLPQHPHRQGIQQMPNKSL